MTLGSDWPTEKLRDTFQTYNLRILGRERKRTGSAPWWMQSMRTSDGRYAYDPDATWTETHYLLRRDVTCESCGHQFGYNFEVAQVSREHESGRGTDGSLHLELKKQLRRRIRCPHCRTVQKEPRRTLLGAERTQTGLACGLVVAGFVLFATLGALGGWVGGIPGFFVGLLLAMAIVIVLWFFAFPYIVGMGPAI